VTTPAARDCMLCRAERITPWYHEDERCWIAQCEICEVPMVVWRSHGVEPPAADLDHMLTRLREVARKEIGAFWLPADPPSLALVASDRVSDPRS